MKYELKNGGTVEVDDSISFFDVYSICTDEKEGVAELNNKEGFTIGTFLYDSHTKTIITNYDENGRLTGEQTILMGENL